MATHLTLWQENRQEYDLLLPTSGDTLCQNFSIQLPTSRASSKRLAYGVLIGRFVLCKMCTPMYASACVVSSNIMISEYRSHENWVTKYRL